MVDRLEESVPGEAWRALALLTAARTAMGFQLQSAAVSAAPLGSEFALSQADIGTLIGLYFLPGILLALPGGALGARFGDKRMVMMGLALMACGGIVSSLAPSFAVVAAGRLVAGIGGVLLNVLMTKMVTDWFSGRSSLFLAMAVFVNSFPLGIGFATLAMGLITGGLDWRMMMGATAVAAFIACMLIGFAYARHPNDSRRAATARAWPSAREIALVSIAGAIWGLFNGVFAVMVGPVPQVGIEAGISPVEVGIVGGVATWLLAASVLAGGALAPKYASPGSLLTLGTLAWAACLAAIAVWPPEFAPAMILAGLVMGLPVGAIMALPSRVLQPDSRALGMGIFFIWLYVGHASVPPAAGLLQDLTGKVGTAAWFAAGLTVVVALLYAAFVRLERSIASRPTVR